MNQAEEFFNTAKARFMVKDLVRRRTEILFVLESPHRDELKQGVPLAGLSGKSMARVLFNDQSMPAMGKYIENQPNSLFGIMNVCSIPMQHTAYPDKKFTELYNKELETLEALRTSQAKSFKDPEKSLMEKWIISDFEQRLHSYLQEGMAIVPCGRFAERYVHKMTLPADVKILSNVPHPSYHSWAKERHKEAIESIRLEEKRRSS